MNASASKSIKGWLAGATALVVIVALILFVLNQSGPEIPAADLSEMEPQVGTRIRMHTSAVTAHPDDVDTWANLAQVFHAHELFPQAIDAYAEARRLRPNDPRWPYLAALAEAKADPVTSLPLFRQAIALQPANAALYINFGDVLIRLGEHEEAKESYRKALTIDPDSTHALYGLAQEALITDKPDMALSLLLRAEALAPYHGEIHSLLAQTYQRLGNDEAARRQSVIARAWPDSTRAPDPVVQAMESMAVDSQSITRRGVSLAKRGEYKAAEEAFLEVLGIRPGNARDYANLGGALAGQGRAEEALTAYRKGLEIEPGDVDTLNNFGFTLMQLRRFDDAEEYLQKALELDPGFDAALGNLGLLAEQQQKPQLAVSYFEQALEQNPGLLFARNALASRLSIQGDMAGAADQWRTVLEINPRELSAIYSLAMALAALGKHGEAIEYLRRGLEIAPNSSRLIGALAWELATAPENDLRNGAEALQMTQRLLTAYPDRPEILDIVAAALAETGEFESAVKVMEKAVELGGGDAMAMRLKAYRQGKPWRQAPTVGVTASVLLPD